MMPNLPKNKLIRLNAPKIDRGAQTKLDYPEYHRTQWRDKRLEILGRDKYQCQICIKKNVYTLASICDHIKPVKEMELKGFSFWEASTNDNLQSLCVSCHAKKSATEKWI